MTLMQGSAVSISQSPQDKRARSPPSAAAKLTRSQLKETNPKLDPEPKSLVDGIGQTPEEQQEAMREETMNREPTTEASEYFDANAAVEPMTNFPMDDPTSPLPSAMPKVISTLRSDMPAKRSTSNKENVEPESALSRQASNYDVLEDAVVSATTPEATRQSSLRPEDQIAALDELDDAVETVSKDIPEVQASPEKPKSKRDKKPAPQVRTTKASLARLSLAQNSKEGASSKTSSLGRPRPSTTLSRSSSVRQSSISKPEPVSKRVTSSGITKDQMMAEGEKKEAVIPHSKPRPFSMSFPTPPPPPKSTKAPTQSTFKLPGEAVAEKLKAAREARMQNQTEGEKKKTFKARPVPAGLSKAPSVRQTNASKARESIMNGKDFRVSTTGPTVPLKRASSVATTRPVVSRPRIVPNEKTKPVTSNNKPSPDSLAVKKRPSTALAALTKPRASLAPSTGTHIAPASSARTSSLQSKSTSKGKEVFNRPAAAKAAAEKEKQEKEAAAKKARADAAERSRQMSREWAEKQKKKQLAAKQMAEKKDEPISRAAEPAQIGSAPPAEVAVDA